MGVATGMAGHEGWCGQPLQYLWANVVHAREAVT
jgi:hypothetical protein